VQWQARELPPLNAWKYEAKSQYLKRVSGKYPNVGIRKKP